ncbi:tryptophan--tRNA ligase [Chitinophagaceae bacterium MMS25-I14]
MKTSIFPSSSFHYLCGLMSKEIVVSGIRSTGFLHLGNYFGAIHNYVKMQEDYNCYFFVADYHSLTTHPDPKDLKSNVFRVAAENIASGLDPEKVALYAQSDVPEIPELYMMLNMLAYKGELERVPTFKEKVRLSPDNVNAGLLTYPVLMAADILIHRAAKVPVGKDQEQHLEMARNFANRFNNLYGSDFFPEPNVFRFDEKTVKIMSLDGNGKMSKSENINSTIYLNDADDAIRAKIKKAKTDAGPAVPNSVKPDYIENLFTLMRLVSTPDIVQKFEDDYNNSSEGNVIIRYGDFKKQLAEDMVAFVAPIREKAQELQHDEDKLRSILKEGAEKARESASKTIAEARKMIGINYY